MSLLETPQTKSSPSHKHSWKARGMSVVYWLFAIFMGFYAAWVMAGNPNLEHSVQIRWATIYGLLCVCLLAAGIGLWFNKKWGIMLSAVLMTAFLVYSIQRDVQVAFIWGIFLKTVIMAPSIFALHLVFWRDFKKV